MSRQYGKLYMVAGDDSYVLKEASLGIDEGFIQEFVFYHPEILPVDELESFFQPLIPICRELITPAGPIDILFVNDKGLLTLVECKLWRNPEARREVVAQILDYAKEIHNWTYEELNAAFCKSIGDHSRTIFDIVSDSSDELDEQDFIDAVTRNLSKGRYLLLIVGDGIRSSVERIGAYLHEGAYLNFSLALVETKIFHCPDRIGSNYIVQPRVLAQTIEIERAAFRIEDEHIIAKPVEEEVTESGTPRRTKISEQAFYEMLDNNGIVSSKLKKLIGEALVLGLELETGQNSLILKYNIGDESFNFGVFGVNSTFRNYGIAAATNIVGHPEIGEQYLESVAALFDDGFVRSVAGRFHWTVRSKSNYYISIPELIEAKDQWLSIVDDTISKINAIVIE